MVNFIDKAKGTFIIFSAQIEHNGILFDKHEHAEKHPDIQKTGYDVQNSPKLILQVDLLGCFVFRGLYWRIVISRWKAYSHTYNYEIAEGHRSLNNDADFAKHIDWDCLVYHFRCGHMTYRHKNTM